MNMSNLVLYKPVTLVSALFLGLVFSLLCMPGAEAAKNVKPIVSATAGGSGSADLTVELGTQVSLDAVASDPDGVVVKYRWQQTEGNRISLMNANSATANVTTPNTLTRNKPLNLAFRVTVTDNKNATATAIVKITVQKNAPPPPPPPNPLVQLNVTQTGTGAALGLGNIKGTDSAGTTVIDCGGACGTWANVGSSITLTTTAYGNAIFTGWSGANCPGLGTCTVLMNADQAVVANFDLKKFTITVNKTGSGTVTSDIGGIDCGNLCTASIYPTETITLTATPETGYLAPAGWVCTGSSPVCTSNIPTPQKDIQVKADFTPIPPPPVKQLLNDTGITGCSNITALDQNCPQSGYLGQDAESGRDFTHKDDTDGHAGFSFTKIDSNGVALAATDTTTPWNCVVDKVTGLMWEVKSADGGLHDKNWTYTWYDGTIFSVANGGICGATSACDTLAYVQKVNAVGWCGKNDWRMPTAEELRSIVSYDRINPAIDTAYFPNTMNAGYFAAERARGFAPRTGGAAAVSFQDGRWYDSYSTPTAYVRLVR
jgi:Protein of unknown function (DUF1566)/Divergent InlB B-repeat domain